MDSAPILSYLEGLDLIRKRAKFNRKQQSSGPRVETLATHLACGRVLAKDYLSQEFLPAFRNSAMDGFAVRSEQTKGASSDHPVRLRVLGSVVAGDPVAEVQSVVDSAWEIMTGAPIPDGLDAIVKVESVERIWDSSGKLSQIEVFAPAEVGQFCRSAGNDFQPGSVIVRQGTLVQPDHVLALSALGVSNVSVYAKPRFAIVSTGRELVSEDQSLKSGQIRNSTLPYLRSILPLLGVQVELERVVGDDPSDFVQALKDILELKLDGVITTGGVSMGKHDYIVNVLMDLRAEIDFHKISMRPGKPNLFGQFPNGPVLFGLPGNPVSTVVGLRFLVESYLREWMGRPSEAPILAQLESDVQKPRELQCFFKALLVSGADIPRVRILAGQDSNLIHPILEANVWAVLPEMVSRLTAGSWIEVYPQQSFQALKEDRAEIGVSFHFHGGCCS